MNIFQQSGDYEKPAGYTPEEWVNYILIRSVKEGASDIHIEPFHEKFLVRFRIDGLLHNVDEEPIDFHETVISRFKIISQLDITEKRKPQEGHAVLNVPGQSHNIDFRISVFPTIFGEAAVIRVLGRKELVFDSFEDMGMTPKDSELFREMIKKPHGMILVTGPAGCGKSTTLYTTLNQIRSPAKSIITLEDPVEYQMDLVRQSQINQDIGYTFLSGMRSILRQDPDVIMIGEIRDKETADIAVRAALTGRLLLSTLHTNDSVGAVTRFLEFSIPPSFVASSLLVVVAKRLVRKVCNHCAQSYVPPEKMLQEAGVAPSALPTKKFNRGAGCAECRFKGYHGRTPIFEILTVDKEIENLILQGATAPKIVDVARSKGMRLLREEALRLAFAGETTLEEALYTTA